MIYMSKVLIFFLLFQSVAIADCSSEDFEELIRQLNLPLLWFVLAHSRRPGDQALGITFDANQNPVQALHQSTRVPRQPVDFLQAAFRDGGDLTGVGANRLFQALCDMLEGLHGVLGLVDQRAVPADDIGVELGHRLGELLRC